MGKWIGWIGYVLWGLLCFLIFLYIFFPYASLGRRVLYLLERRAHLIAQSSDATRRLLGLGWDRVELISTRYRNLPPIHIKDWIIQLRPRSVVLGRLTVASHGALLGGSFRSNIVVGANGWRGTGHWKDVRLDSFPLFIVNNASLSGVASGSAQWAHAEERLEGETAFELQNGSVENVFLAGMAVPRLDLGRVEGRFVLEGGEIEVKEILVEGGDLSGKLTGKVLLGDPLPRSRLACQLEVIPTEQLVNRYPILEGLLGREISPSRPLTIAISGTLAAPLVSPAR